MKLLSTILLLFIGSTLFSQELVEPRISHFSSTSIRVGITDIKISYNSPQVREREIWGKLVPYNRVWRAGADNNTIFEVSHSVLINGQSLAAGKYGLHMIPDKEDWIMIFSKNHTSWGSFTYSETEDALRIVVKIEEIPFQEYLSYEFLNRSKDSVEVSLNWETVRVPFKIEVDVNKIVLESFKTQLRSKSQFDWKAWYQAANYCLHNDIDLEQGLDWVNHSTSGFFASKETFENLKTKAEILYKLNRTEEGKIIMVKALEHPTASPADLYLYGRQKLNQNQLEKATEIFQINKEKFPEHWLSNHGLARFYSKKGQFDKALKFERNALKDAPDRSRKVLKEYINKLENNIDFN